MSDTLITFIAIVLAAIMMFMFPLLSVSERNDDIAQLSVQTATTKFVDKSRAIGKITMENYSELVSTIQATGNSYDIEIEVKILDENIGKKSAWAQGTVIGENVYVSVFTAQIVEVLETEGVYRMGEGAILSTEVKNNNKTLSQSLRGLFYSISTGENYSIAAQASGIVTATASEV